MNTPSLIQMFNTRVAYDETAKEVFHRVGRNVMRNLAVVPQAEKVWGPGELFFRS